jgi:hypothetical protein
VKTISLEEAYERSIKDERFLLEKVSISKEKPFFILSLKGVNSIFFLHKFFVENEIHESKIFLYKIALVNTYYYERLNGEVFNVLDTFTYPLLSDSSTLIKRYLHYDRTEYVDAFSTYFGKAIQSVLRSDFVALQFNIGGLKKWSTKGWPKQYAGIVTVFEGFLTDDKTTIEKGLLEIIELHGKQDHPGIVKDYINLEATALAKLAWRRGIEVEVSSDLILRELLPVKELPFYEGYPFFDELD